MGGQSQPSNQVYYDSDMGQYYTQAPKTYRSGGRPLGGMPNGLDVLGALFGENNSGRTYINGFGQRQQVQQAPYEYDDVSLESLFPQIASNSSQIGATGLLGGTATGATGQASSGAGRFM